MDFRAWSVKHINFNCPYQIDLKIMAKTYQFNPCIDTNGGV